jgi:hypothetical protein
MKPEQEEMVEPSSIPRTDIVAALFYATLFEIDPELSLTFEGNLLERIRADLLKAHWAADQSQHEPTSEVIANCPASSDV